MKTWIRAAAATCLLAGAPPAQESLSDSTLRDLKAATVLIRTSRGSGSGFIIRRDGRAACVLTCAHVINGTAPDEVTGVWHAGTDREVTVRFKILGVDTAGDMAALRCDLKDPPAPIPLAPASRLRETLPVFVAGFPFGEWLKTNSRAPAPTISKASVSSIKADEFGALRLVQLDGELNPGNSGGPIVDAKGALIGMAAAKVSDAKIAFAVASTEIADLMEGRVFPPVLVGGAGDENSVKVRVFTGLVDPLKRVRSPVLLLVPQVKLPGAPKPGDKGVWGAISGEAEETALRVVDGVIDQEITVRKGDSDEGRFVAQVKYARDGNTRWTAPVSAQFEFRLKAPPSKEPEAGRRPEPPPPADGMKLDFEVRLDEEGRDAILVLESAETDVPRWKRVRWNERNQAEGRAYSGDLKTAYLLNQDRGSGSGRKPSSLVRKINLETLREERSLFLGRSYERLDLGPTGLVLTTFVPGQGSESLVLDPVSLQVVGRLSGFGTTMLITRASPLGVVMEGKWISLFDVQKNAVVNRLSLKDLASRKEKPKVAPGSRVAETLRTAALTPDGRYLVAEEEGCLHRFRVKGTDLVYEEVGPRLNPSEIPFVLSPDSRHVLVLAIPEEREKYREKGVEKVRSKPFIDERWLYKVESLATPACRIKGFGLGHFTGFDPSGGFIFARVGSRDASDAKDFVKLAIDGRRVAEHPGAAVSGFPVSPTRILRWGPELVIFDFPK